MRMVMLWKELLLTTELLLIRKTRMRTTVPQNSERVCGLALMVLRFYAMRVAMLGKELRPITEIRPTTKARLKMALCTRIRHPVFESHLEGDDVAA
jgi:hypothetical protein